MFPPLPDLNWNWVLLWGQASPKHPSLVEGVPISTQYSNGSLKPSKGTIEPVIVPISFIFFPLPPWHNDTEITHPPTPGIWGWTYSHCSLLSSTFYHLPSPSGTKPCPFVLLNSSLTYFFSYVSIIKVEFKASVIFYLDGHTLILLLIHCRNPSSTWLAKRPL